MSHIRKIRQMENHAEVFQSDLSLETSPFDRADITQLAQDGRESLIPATLIVSDA